MSIRLPKDPAYFFECTGRAERLFLWLPPAHLKELVKNKRAKRTILRDFPHGVDVKVSTQGFTELEREYGVEPDVDPEEVYRAFIALVEKDRKPALRSGLIQKRFLDGLARTVTRELKTAGIPPSPLRLEETPRKRRRTAFHRQVSQNRKVRKLFRGLEVPRFREDRSLTEQTFAQVEMDEGDEPGKVFEAVQRPRRRDRDGHSK